MVIIASQAVCVAGVHGARSGHVRGHHQQFPLVWHCGTDPALHHRLHRRGIRQQVRCCLPLLRHHLHHLHLHWHLCCQPWQQRRVSGKLASDCWGESGKLKTARKMYSPVEVVVAAGCKWTVLLAYTLHWANAPPLANVGQVIYSWAMLCCCSFSSV